MTKNIDEIYKDWYGESHLNTSNIPTHDSAKAQDFAQYYHKVKMDEKFESKDALKRYIQLTIPFMMKPLRPAKKTFIGIFRNIKAQEKVEDELTESIWRRLNNE